MAKVEINVAGCDDNTIFEVYVSAAELHFLNMIAAKSVETSTYGCMPIIRITPLEQSKDVQADGNQRS